MYFHEIFGSNKTWDKNSWVVWNLQSQETLTKLVYAPTVAYFGVPCAFAFEKFLNIFNWNTGWFVKTHAHWADISQMWHFSLKWGGSPFMPLHSRLFIAVGKASVDKRFAENSHYVKFYYSSLAEVGDLWVLSSLFKYTLPYFGSRIMLFHFGFCGFLSVRRNICVPNRQWWVLSNMCYVTSSWCSDVLCCDTYVIRVPYLMLLSPHVVPGSVSKWVSV